MTCFCSLVLVLRILTPQKQGWRIEAHGLELFPNSLKNLFIPVYRKEKTAFRHTPP